jgi:F-type H+-transporting ATPase subunit b
VFNFNMTLIAQIVNFLILVFILTKLAYKPLLKAMADRQARIANDLASAEKERLAAEQLRLEYQQQMADARSQGQMIVDKAVKTAEQMKQEILEEARTENARMLKNAQDEIARQTEQAMAGIRGEVVALTIAAATKVIEKEMSAEINAKLVADFIEKLDDKKIGGLPC